MFDPALTSLVTPVEQIQDRSPQADKQDQQGQDNHTRNYTSDKPRG
jgi:hypothetical protein